MQWTCKMIGAHTICQNSINSTIGDVLRCSIEKLLPQSGFHGVCELDEIAIMMLVISWTRALYNENLQLAAIESVCKNSIRLAYVLVAIDTAALKFLLMPMQSVLLIAQKQRVENQRIEVDVIVHLQQGFVLVVQLRIC